MIKNTRFRITVFVLAVLLLLTACGNRVLTGDDRAAVLAFSEPAADNLLAGMHAGDYAIASRDFNADMLAGMPADAFASFKETLDAKIGAYVSREVSSVIQSGENYIVIYQAKYEQEDKVTIRLVFEVAEPHAVSGLWFDSPKLREQ